MGLNNAKNIWSKLKPALNELKDNPELGRERLEIKGGIRSLVAGNT